MLCGDDAGSGGMEGSWLLRDLCRLRRVTGCVELVQSVRVDEVKSRRAMRGTGIEIARYNTTIDRGVRSKLEVDQMRKFNLHLDCVLGMSADFGMHSKRWTEAGEQVEAHWLKSTPLGENRDCRHSSVSCCCQASTHSL